MREKVYGTQSFRAWTERLATDRSAAKDLSDTKVWPLEVSSQPPDTVTSFWQLAEAVSFLTLMNKTLVLLYRGQGADHPLLPSLLRNDWRIFGHDHDRAKLGMDREHYWQELLAVEQRTLAVLDEHGMPRWRPFRDYRSAGWAIIQHYELWPTPLLDVTASLNIAASFALGLGDDARPAGMLYVLGVPTVRSDLMTLKQEVKESASWLTIRLNAVCPPSARRPHLQAGLLIGLHPFEQRHVFDANASDAAAILMAKFRLNNEGGDFWDDDFPVQTKHSLLPPESRDPLLAAFRRNIVLVRHSSGRVSLDRDRGVASI